MKHTYLAVLVFIGINTGLQADYSWTNEQFQRAGGKITEARNKKLGTIEALQRRVMALQKRLNSLITQNAQLGEALRMGSDPVARLAEMSILLQGAQSLGDVPFEDIIAELENIDEMLKSYESGYSAANR